MLQQLLSENAQSAIVMLLLWEPSRMHWSADLLQRHCEPIRTPAMPIEIFRFFEPQKALEKIRAPG
jgi:hypothetical protein